MFARCRVTVFVALAATLVGACASDCNEPHATWLDASSGADAHAPAEASVRNEAGTAKDAGTLPTLSAAEKQAFHAYGAAMTRGREATRAKKWSAARDAFLEARNQKPGDARADAELAYAELLSGNVEIWSIITTLERARDESHDDALTAQIWFNLGLAYEKKEDADSAAVAFWRSDVLAPSAAAKSKLHGRAFPCGVRARRDANAGRVYDGWLAAFRALLAVDRKNPPPGISLEDLSAEPKSDAEAREIMCGGENSERCDRSGAFTVRVGADFQFAIHVMISLPEKKLLAFDRVGSESTGGRCGNVDTVTLISGKYVVARVLHKPSDMTMVALDTGDCDGASEVCGVMGIHECRADEECHVACFAAGWTSAVFVYDVAEKRELLALERAGNIAGFQADPVVPEIDARIDRGIVRDVVRVGGCTESFPLGATDVRDQ